MDFKSAGDKVRSLIAAKKPGQLSASALTKDPLRDAIVRESEQHSDRFRAACTRKPEVSYEVDGSPQQFTWDSYGEAVRDIARASWSLDSPELLPPDKVRASHQFNRAIEEHTINSDDFQQSYPYTRGNEAESQFAAMRFGQAMQEQAPEVAEHIARASQMAEQEKEIDDAESMFDRLRQRAKQEAANGGEVSPNTKREIKRSLKQGEQARGALGKLIDEHVTSGYVQAAADVAKAGREAMKEAAQMISSLPGIEPGQAHNVDPETQIKLAEKWQANAEMRKVLKMLGRMTRDFRFKREARTKNVRVEPVGVTTGNDLSALLPHEFARAYRDELKPLFMKDFAEGALLQYDFVGKERAGKGPIIELHDGSGSMKGEKFVWATSLALTLATGAAREKRDFAGVEFGSRGQVKSWMFLANEPADPEQFLDFATHFYGGGTSTVGGFEEALRIMREYPQFETADIVLIGDGIDRFGERDKQVQAELRKLNVRVHGITIMTPNNPYFAQMCDWHVDVSDLAGPNAATDALAEQLT